MNKLLGFYELKSSELPTILWKEYKPGTTVLDDFCLWTVRSAVYRGDDYSLPRRVGVNAKEAKEFADSLYGRINSNGIVIYYPYFVAEKSGTLCIGNDKIIIEAVKQDLWNLVTFSDCDVTIQITGDIERVRGDAEFLTLQDKCQILSYVKYVKKMFREDLLEGKNVLLEWSFAYNCDLDKNIIGKRYLVFYEARTIE